ncbi:MAG: hypothetical protein D6826_08740 [Alphaproteobacteria bacterium]|nr:MAG: hypothetical protein D6826_08740 [Alphaproteobacteria bacterium]
MTDGRRRAREETGVIRQNGAVDATPAAGKPLFLLAVMSSEPACQAVHEAAATLDGVRCEAWVGAPSPAFTDAPPPEVDAVLLDLDPDDVGAMTVVQRLRAGPLAAVPVIVAAPATTCAATMRRLFHLGMVDVVLHPLRASDLHGALVRARAAGTGMAGAQERRGRVVAFLKAGGGAGATTLAVQAGCLLAAGDAGTAGEARGVCLLDFDVQAGTAALFLDLDDRVGLADLLDAADRLDGELLRSVMTRHDSGLHVLAAPREVLPLDVVAPEVVDDCLALARCAYDTVLIDLPGAWTAWSHRIVQNADLVVLVMQMGVDGVRRARRHIETMRRHGLDGVALCLVLNRHRRHWGHRAEVREVERALGRPFDCIVPSDFALVREAIDRGVPLHAVRRRSKVESGLRRLLAMIAGAGGMPPHGSVVLQRGGNGLRAINSKAAGQGGDEEWKSRPTRRPYAATPGR